MGYFGVLGLRRRTGNPSLNGQPAVGIVLQHRLHQKLTFEISFGPFVATSFTVKASNSMSYSLFPLRWIVGVAIHLVTSAWLPL